VGGELAGARSLNGANRRTEGASLCNCLLSTFDLILNLGPPHSANVNLHELTEGVDNNEHPLIRVRTKEQVLPRLSFNHGKCSGQLLTTV
jgi:hypothetical protein